MWFALKLSRLWVIVVSVLIVLSVIIPVLAYYRLPRYGIDISKDSDFNRYFIPGAGTLENPYRIENLEFTKTRTPYQALIKISSTSKNFIIQNCTFKNVEYGIRLYDLSNFSYQIKNCVFENTKWNPIKITKVSEGSVVIDNCEFRNGGRSIVLNNFENLTISNCEFSSNYEIVSLSTEFNQLYGEPKISNYEVNNKNFWFVNNTLVENKMQFSICYTNNVILDNNYFYSSPGKGAELYILDAFHLTMININLSNYAVSLNMFDIEFYDNILIENTFLNGRNLQVHKNKTDLNIDEKYSYFLFYNCRNISFIEQNFSEESLSNRLNLINCQVITISQSDFEGYSLSFLNCSEINITNSSVIEGSFYFRNSTHLNLYQLNMTAGLISIRYSQKGNLSYIDATTLEFYLSFSQNISIEFLNIACPLASAFGRKITIINSTNILITNSTAMSGRTAVAMYYSSNIDIYFCFFISINYFQVFTIYNCTNFRIENNTLAFDNDVDLVSGNIDQEELACILANNTITYI